MNSKNQTSQIDLLDLVAYGASTILRYPAQSAALVALLANNKTRAMTLRLMWLYGKETARASARMVGGTARIASQSLGLNTATMRVGSIVSKAPLAYAGAAGTLGTIVLALKYPQAFGVKPGFYLANEALSTPEMKAYETSAIKSAGTGRHIIW